MKRGTGILIAAAAALLIALPVGWYFGSPWWTLWRIREAARAGDVKALDSYVDWNAVRNGFWSQAQKSWGSVIAEVRPNGDGARRLIGLAKRILAKPATDGLSSSDGDRIRAWLAEIPVGTGGLSEGKDQDGRRPAIVHHGLNEFSVIDPGASKEAGPVLTFRRHGLGWKLEGVRFGQQ
ncbi:MAG TPA: DUF2939 domain-containing protein [Allosphingosinicella sp.]|jgi:hypothetical protein|nr:DUF2939 domain-containing protein [Allosphingosinicella sp.]